MSEQARSTEPSATLARRFVTRQVRFICELCDREFTTAYTARADEPLTYLYDECPDCHGEALAVACLGCSRESPEEGTDYCASCNERETRREVAAYTPALRSFTDSIDVEQSVEQ